MEKESKEITLEQAKRFRLILRIAFVLIAFITPIIITGVRFKIFTQATTAKWSIIGLLLILVIAWRFKKKLSEWINSWEDGNIFKHVIIGVAKVWPFMLIVAILGIIQWSANSAGTLLKDVLFCIEWACACELVSYLLIYPFEMKYDYLVKRMIRKNERKADYKEAIREMKKDEETING